MVLFIDKTSPPSLLVVCTIAHSHTICKEEKGLCVNFVPFPGGVSAARILLGKRFFACNFSIFLSLSPFLYYDRKGNVLNHYSLEIMQWNVKLEPYRGASAAPSSGKGTISPGSSLKASRQPQRQRAFPCGTGTLFRSRNRSSPARRAITLQPLTSHPT